MNVKRSAVAAFLLVAVVCPRTFALDTDPPTVTEVTADGTPLPGAVLTSAPSSIIVTFSEEMDASTVTTDTFRLVRSGGDGTFGDGNEVQIAPVTVAPTTGNVVTMDLGGAATPNDAYRLTILGTDVTTGLVGHWKFEEGSGGTASDSSASANDGTLVSGATWTTGRIAGGLGLETGADYVDMGDIAEADFGAGDFTISAWALMHTTTDETIVSKNEAEFNYGYALWVQASELKIELLETYEAKTAPPTSGEWHYIVGLRRGDVLELYVDGLLASTASGAGSADISSAQSFRIGVRTNGTAPGGVANDLHGLVDDVRIYNRALTAQEIYTLATPGVHDLASNMLDGDGDTFAGGDYVCDFDIDDPPPVVTNVRADGTLLPDAVLTSAPSSIVVTFSEHIDPATVTTDTFRLVRSGGDGTFTDGNEVEIVPVSVTLDGTGTQATTDLTGVTKPDDVYQVAVSGGDGPTGGLVAHWKLDETSGTTAADSSGSGRDGTAVNGPIWRPTGGRFGGALEFDGSNDYVEFSSVSQRAISVSTWVNVTGSGTSNNPRIVDMPCYFLHLTVSTGVIAFDGHRSGTGGEWHGPAVLVGTGWHHVAVTYDGTSTANDPMIYVDGAAVSVTEYQTPSGTLTDNAGTGNIGNRPGIGGRPFDGLIDEVRIYDRVLSSEEVLVLASVPPTFITDLSANPLDGEFTGSFPSGDGTAGGDFVCAFRINANPPYVVSTSPTDGATDLPLSSDVTVTFNEPMDPATAAAAFSIDPAVSGTPAVSGAVLTLQPSGGLASDTEYTVTISTAATDLVGLPLVAEYTFTFTTIDLTAPADVTDFALAPASEQIEITWRNPYDLDFAGVVVLRSVDEAPTGAPADGTTYIVGNVIGNAVVVYVGAGTTGIPGDRSGLTQEGLENGREYHYAVFTHDDKLNYSAGVSASAVAGASGGGDGGLCSAGSCASPILMALALAALGALASRQRSRT